MKTLIDSIVKYWSDFLKDPNSFQFDNDDKLKSYPRHEIDAFQEMLYNEIAKQLPTQISIDYHANGILAEVANKTLSKWSDMHTFPIKTNMSIDYKEQLVTISQGYCAPTRILFEGNNCE